MTDKLPVQNLDLAGSALQKHIEMFNHVPVLSREEEYSLAMAYQERGDLQAAQKLVLSNMRYVVMIARSYNGYGLPLADLLQEGAMGLMKAVKRFNPKMGVRLVTFASHWIKAEMQEFILRNWRIVRVATTKAQRKLFFKLRSSKKRLGWFTKEEREQVANDLNVTAKDVEEMEARLSSNEVSFDLDEDEDSTGNFLPSPSSYVESKTEDPANLVISDNLNGMAKEQLYLALEKLDDRSKDILTKRWLNEDKTTLKDLSYVYSVSLERIRQLESEALQQLRNALTEADIV